MILCTASPSLIVPGNRIARAEKRQNRCGLISGRSSGACVNSPQNGHAPHFHVLKPAITADSFTLAAKRAHAHQWSSDNRVSLFTPFVDGRGRVHWHHAQKSEEPPVRLKQITEDANKAKQNLRSQEEKKEKGKKNGTFS